MRILGAVLAGGRSTRFGSDKASALFDGKRLIDRVAAALEPQVAAMIVTGRDEPGRIGVPDRPAPGLGPLGGITAALHHAADAGFDMVLTVPCDVPFLPRIVDILAPGDRYLADAPVIGLWRAEHAAAAARFVITDPRRSVHGWANSIGAIAVTGPRIANINTVQALNALNPRK